jgi:hypothetical protein
MSADLKSLMIPVKYIDEIAERIKEGGPSDKPWYGFKTRDNERVFVVQGGNVYPHPNEASQKFRKLMGLNI